MDFNNHEKALPPPREFVQPPSYELLHHPIQQQPQQQQAPPAQIVTVVKATAFGTESMPMQCPSCRSSIRTRVDFVSTSRTHTNALLVCLLCGPCCAWIPYVSESCMAANHYCPNCDFYLGRHQN